MVLWEWWDVKLLITVSYRNSPFSFWLPVPGNVDTAMNILREFDSRVPGLALIRTRMRNLERRTAIRLAQL